MFRRCAFLTLVLATAALAGPASAAAAKLPVDCFLLCPEGRCTITQGNPAKSRVLEQGRVNLVEQCAQVRLVDGSPLEGRFMSSRGVERFVVTAADKDKDASFGTLVASLARGLCAAGPVCSEARDGVRVAGVGGKGIDHVASRRVGTPCAWGLPCATILRPSVVDFQLEPGAPAQGRLVFKGLRQVKGEWSAPVQDGRVAWPADMVQPGAAYAYSLFDAAGLELAAGEFSVLSTKMQADVEAELAQALRTPADAGPLGRAAVLLDNDLAWDARQLMR